MTTLGAFVAGFLVGFIAAGAAGILLVWAFHLIEQCLKGEQEQ